MVLRLDLVKAELIAEQKFELFENWQNINTDLWGNFVGNIYSRKEWSKSYDWKVVQR